VKLLEEEKQEDVQNEDSEIKQEEVDLNNLKKNTEKEIVKEKPEKENIKGKAKKLFEELQAKVKKLEEEKKDLEEQFLRKRADFENFRKRMEKDKSDFIKYSLEKFVKELLPVLDSFNSALTSDNSSEEQKSVFSGFELINKQLKDIFSKNGISEIDALGESFDPSLHQAIAQEKTEGESGIVIKEYQKGFKLHDRILRPSMVVVSE
jgi:molecular chaperone GrpE